jgi:SAM-dependent methyltransferase
MLPLARQNAYRARYAQLNPGWRSSGDELEALARHHIRSGARVLDVGCGRGGVLELLWPAAALAVGLDPDWRSLAGQRTSMPLACGLGEALPFASAVIDVAVAVWVLEHLPRPEFVLGEIYRVLRPGGRFLVLTPNVRHPLLWANRAGQLVPAVQRALVPALYGRAEADTFRVHYRANTPARLAALAVAAGFQVETLRTIADPTYLAFNEPLFRLSLLLERCLPVGWGVHLLGVLVKPA